MLAVETDKDWKMTSAIEFNVAGVQKPLASAARIVKSGNRVMLDQDGSFVENKRTGEGMEVRVKDGTFVFEVELTNGELGGDHPGLRCGCRCGYGADARTSP